MSSLPTRALCVGGPHHGEYLPTFDSWEVRVPKERDLYAEYTATEMTSATRAPIFVTGSYRLDRVPVPTDDGDPCWVLVWKGWGK